MFRPFRVFVALSCVGMALLLTACPSPSDPATNDDLKPEAAFRADILIGNTPLMTQFFDASFEGSSPIVLRHWNFGDGSVSEERNPIHTYLAAGTYSVSLTVTSGCGTNTTVRSNYIEVREPLAVQSVGPAGTSTNNPLAYNGATLIVPAGAFESDVVIGISKDTTTIPIAGSELLISSVYKIQHNQTEVRIDPRNPMTLELTFATDSVPLLDRVPSKVQIIALLPDSSLVPILGTFRGDVFTAPIAGLPQSAVYAVLYRPTGHMQSAVASTTKATPSDFTWDANQWRVIYSDANLQELTALRVGALANLSPFDSRDFTPSQLATTTQELVATIASIHESFRDAGFRSPTLLETPAREYSLIINDMTRLPIASYTNLSDVIYAKSIFGDIVIDPGQLIAICKANAAKGIDQAQKLDLANVFAQEFFRAIYRGYIYPENALSELWGFENGMATYAGQLMAGLTNARALGNNETVLLNEPLFAADSATHPGYSYASQDFLFYVRAMLGLTANPFDYFGSTSYGVLDLVRVSEYLPSPSTDPINPLQSAYAGFSLALRNTGVLQLQDALSSLYGTYATDMAYGNSVATRLRPSDAERVVNTFNANRFASDMVISDTFRSDDMTTVYQAVTKADEAFYTIPPLSTRAFVFTAENVEANIRLVVNPALWMPDPLGHTLNVTVYKEGSTGQALTLAMPQVTLTGFGSLRGFDRAIVLVSNVTLNKSYDFALTAQTLPPTAADQFGVLAGKVTATDGITPLQNVGVTVNLRTGSVIGQWLAYTTTNAAGNYTFPAISAGEVQVTYSKSGYVTKTQNLTVAPAATTTLNTTMTPGKE